MTEHVVSRLRKFATGRTAWALGDQGMVSLGNFAVNIILARNVSTTEFGIYALSFSVFLVLNGLQGAFVNYPLTIRISKEDASEVPRLTGLAMMLTAGLLVPLGTGLVIYFYIIDRPSLIPYALLAFIAWRFQDVLRRTLMAQLRFRGVLPGDAVSYLGQAGVMLCLIYFDKLTLEAVFLAIAGTSALAAVAQSIQVGLRFSHPSAMGPFIKECWELGRWVVMRRLIGIVQLQGVGWVLAAFHGVEATASMRAAVNVLAVTHPIMMGITNLIVPSVAHAYRRGIRPAMRATGLLSIQGAVFVFPYFLGLALFPSDALGLMYGPESPYRLLGDVLVILAMTYTMNFVSRMLSGSLGGLARPDIAFRAALFGTTAAIVIAFPLAAWGGIFYAAIGTLLAQIVSISAVAYFLRREVVREMRQPAPGAALGDT